MDWDKFHSAVSHLENVGHAVTGQKKTDNVSKVPLNGSWTSKMAVKGDMKESDDTSGSGKTGPGKTGSKGDAGKTGISGGKGCPPPVPKGKPTMSIRSNFRKDVVVDGVAEAAKLESRMEQVDKMGEVKISDEKLAELQRAKERREADASTKGSTKVICPRCQKACYPEFFEDHWSSHSSEIRPWFYLGGRRNAENAAELIKRTQITHILNVAAEIHDILPLDLKGQFIENTVPMLDSACQPLLPPLKEATAYIHRVHLENPQNHVLLHCTQGISRSASCAIAYLMQYEGKTLRSAYFDVKGKRKIADPRPNFIRELQVLEKELFPMLNARIPTLTLDDLPTLTVEEIFGGRTLLNFDVGSKNQADFEKDKESESTAAQKEAKKGLGGVKDFRYRKDSSCAKDTTGVSKEPTEAISRNAITTFCKSPKTASESSPKTIGASNTKEATEESASAAAGIDAAGSISINATQPSNAEGKSGTEIGADPSSGNGASPPLSNGKGKGPSTPGSKGKGQPFASSDNGKGKAPAPPTETKFVPRRSIEPSYAGGAGSTGGIGTEIKTSTIRGLKKQLRDSAERRRGSGEHLSDSKNSGRDSKTDQNNGVPAVNSTNSYGDRGGNTGTGSTNSIYYGARPRERSSRREVCPKCGNDYALSLGGCPTCDDIGGKRKLVEKKDPLTDWRPKQTYTARQVATPGEIPFEKIEDYIALSGGSGGVFLYDIEGKLVCCKWLKEPHDGFAIILNRALNGLTTDARDDDEEEGNTTQNENQHDNSLMQRYDSAQKYDSTQIRLAYMRLMRQVMRPVDFMKIMRSWMRIKMRSWDPEKEYDIDTEVDKHLSHLVEMGRNFLGVLEVVPGLQGLTGLNGLCKVPERYRERILFDIGKMTAFDAVINNSDRVPLKLLWFNEGNFENIMIERTGEENPSEANPIIAKTGRESTLPCADTRNFDDPTLNDAFRIIGIDSTFSPIVSDSAALIYRTRLEKLCYMVATKSYDEIVKDSSLHKGKRIGKAAVPKRGTVITLEEARSMVDENKVDWVYELIDALYCVTGVNYDSLESFIIGMKVGFRRFSERLGTVLDREVGSAKEEGLYTGPGPSNEAGVAKNNGSGKHTSIRKYLDYIKKPIDEISKTMEDDCLVVNPHVGTISSVAVQFVADNLSVVHRQFGAASGAKDDQNIQGNRV